MEFSGKTVLVTGGASGIGRAVSLAFGRAGANVVLSYVTSAREAARGRGRDRGRRRAGPVPVRRPYRCRRGRRPVRRVARPLRPGRHPRRQRRRLAQAQPLRRHGSGFLGAGDRLEPDQRVSVLPGGPRRDGAAGSGAIVLMSSLAAFDGGGPGASTTPRPRARSSPIRGRWRRRSARSASGSTASRPA